MQNKGFVKRFGYVLPLFLIVTVLYGAANAQISSMESVLNASISASKSVMIAENGVYRTYASGARAGGQSSAGRPVPQPMRQYPITATDFWATPGYLLPDQLASSAQNLTSEQREALRTLYTNILQSFERGARKNNMANAFAFAVGASIQVVGGRQLSEAYLDNLIGFYNSRIASNPQFAAMPSTQKQDLYEHLVITGGVIAFLDAQGRQTNDMAMRSQALEMSKVILKNFAGIDVNR